MRFAEEDKVKITVGNKMIAGVGLEPNHVGAPCCETWRKKMKLKIFVAVRKKMFGSWVTPLVGRHVVNETKVA